MAQSKINPEHIYSKKMDNTQGIKTNVYLDGIEQEVLIGKKIDEPDKGISYFPIYTLDNHYLNQFFLT